jgi:hypothetical protein
MVENHPTTLSLNFVLLSNKIERLVHNRSFTALLHAAALVELSGMMGHIQELDGSP